MEHRDHDRSPLQRLKRGAGKIEQHAKVKLDDLRITAEIRSALLDLIPVTGLEVTVDTDHGVAHLRGEVVSDWQKAEAERIARQVCPPGVRQIINEIRVNPNLHPIIPL